MYDPPSETNWGDTHWFDEIYKEAYDKGYEAGKLDKNHDDNPYEPSGHERDSTLNDELGYWWYIGLNDYYEGDEK